MAEVAYNQNPTITDTVVFDLYVPDANGCFSEMPYKVNNLTIYFVERNFQSGNQAIYKEKIYDSTQQITANAAEAIACNEITPSNIINARLSPGSEISDISATNPAQITSALHGLSSGNMVFLLSTNSVPPIDGEYEVTVIDGNTFSVPVDFSGCVPGDKGFWYTSQYIKQHARDSRQLAESGASTSDFYFDQANPVHIVGDSTYPAWITGWPIDSITNAYPPIITSVDHELTTGDEIYIYGTNATPAIDGLYRVTVLTADTFTINVDLSAGLPGNKGFWYTPEENSNNFLDMVTVNGKTTVGLFKYYWEPSNVREGDFFICWTWTPLPGGDSLSSHLKFSLAGNTAVTTIIPSHFTNPEKYPTLLTRYTPEMFKEYLSSTDRTPDIIDKFNQSVALGFKTLEDLANQIVDLQNPNVLAEPLIPYLANFFNLKLKSNDPARWRGQIVRAVSSFKSKGTRGNLATALSLAGMRLTGLYQLWQVVSKYTWQEAFVYEDSLEFVLERTLVEPEPGPSIDPDNFELYVRYVDSSSWVQLDSSYVEFSTVDSVTTMTWVGSTHSTTPISLTTGDTVRVLYQYAEVPDSTEQMLEDYVRLLSLIDTRNERAQIYPLKNWNVRGIQENDALFNMIVPARNPFFDFIVFGKIRTEFPYSENIYNMDEYNGSIRDSRQPCDIGRDFLDSCFSCISSSYVVDVEITDISNDRIQELYEVLQENSPFHAVLHTANVYGGFHEFITSPLEEISGYLMYYAQGFAIAGYGQQYFNRTMRLSNLNDLPNSQAIFRGNDGVHQFLADSTTVVPGQAAVAYNTDVVLYSPNQTLEGIGIKADGSTQLEILDGPYAGTYDILDATGKMVKFNTAPTEPIDNCDNVFTLNGELNSCTFPFRIYQPVIDTFLPDNVSPPGGDCVVEKDNVIVFTDASKDWAELGILTEFDEDYPSGSGSVTAYEMSIPAYGSGTFKIVNADPSGSLILEYDSALPTASVTGLTYEITNTVTATTVTSGAEGAISVTFRGKVTVQNYALLPISQLIANQNHYLVVGASYPITSMVPGTENQFYIGEWNSANTTTPILVNRWMISAQIGYLSYRGLNLRITGVDYEDPSGTLKIQNGYRSLPSPPRNSTLYPNPIYGNQDFLPPEQASYQTLECNEDQTDFAFMENYIVQIDGGEYYWITAANGDDGRPYAQWGEISPTSPSTGYTTLVISGTPQYWKTLANSGTNVSVNIYKYIPKGATIMGQQYDLPEHSFRVLDRSGGPVITGIDGDDATLVSLSAGQDQFHDSIKQTEGVSFKITYANGNEEEGEI